jgi:hypothetical protein
MDTQKLKDFFYNLINLSICHRQTFDILLKNLVLYNERTITQIVEESSGTLNNLFLTKDGHYCLTYLIDSNKEFKCALKPSKLASKALSSEINLLIDKNDYSLLA